MDSGPQDVVAALLAEPRAALLAVDFDGTLAPIVARPEDARPVDEAREVLAALAARLGGVAIVSGRAADEVVRLADVDSIPGLRVLGHYGLQQWRDGAVASPDPVPGVAVARARLRDVLEGADQLEGNIPRELLDGAALAGDLGADLDGAAGFRPAAQLC